VTWAFEFEDQPYFYGFRDLSTNGLPKPVLNVFRMLGQMGGDRVSVESSGSVPLETVRDVGVRERADITALASRQERSVAILVWNYHDDDLPAPDADVTLTIAGLPVSSVQVTHSRVDRDRSNTYEAWKKMGSPQPPSQDQLAALEKAGALYEVGPTRTGTTAGELSVTFPLPRQGVSLVKLTW
jgi:xylan 1,4-beta-xylosidase